MKGGRLEREREVAGTCTELPIPASEPIFRQADGLEQSFPIPITKKMSGSQDHKTHCETNVTKLEQNLI